MIVDELIDKIIEKQNPTCVGLDTAPGYLPENIVAGLTASRSTVNAVFNFNKIIIDAVADIVPAVKVQMAYCESLGLLGVTNYYATCHYAREKGLIVITDAKRNDIGSTALQYADAYLRNDGEFRTDFLTVNGYLGTDGIEPFVDACVQNDRGIFVLVKTSNPSSGELQNLKLADGRTVYECMGDMVAAWGGNTFGRYGYTRVGAVVGATYPEEARRLRERLPRTFFLVPGYGAQGGNAEMLKNCFAEGGMGAIVNNSRGILCAYKQRGGDIAEAARAAALEMREDLRSVLGEICVK